MLIIFSQVFPARCIIWRRSSRPKRRQVH